MGHPLKRWPEMGIPITMSDLKFMRFIAKEIFPGGAVPCDDDVAEFAGRAGFSVESLNYLTPHYVRTLDIWSQRLEAAREQAIEFTSQEVYDRYMHYLVGCSDFFNRGVSEVGQFTLVKALGRTEHQHRVVPADAERVGHRVAVVRRGAAGRPPRRGRCRGRGP